MAMVDAISIQTELVNFINNRTYFTDPYETQSGQTRGDGSSLGLATATEYDTIVKFPRVIVKLGPEELARINASKTKPITTKSLIFNIYYYSRDKAQLVVDSTTYTNEKHVYKYLEIIRDTILDNMGLFTNFHQIKFGEISEPQKRKEDGIWWGFMPISITYKKAYS